MSPNRSRSPIRVAIVDDHTLLRSGLRLLLAREEDIQLVAEGETGEEALRIVQEHHPDVLILDLTMPRMDGVSCLRLLPAETSTRVLILTMHEDEEHLRECLRLGAAGFLSKSVADTELIHAIRAVASGRRYVDPTLAATLVARGIGDSEEEARRPVLSEREREVLQRIALGYTNRETARELHISVKTVETYRLRVMQKLGVSTRAELVQEALRLGLVTPPAYD